MSTEHTDPNKLEPWIKLLTAILVLAGTAFGIYKGCASIHATNSEQPTIAEAATRSFSGIIVDENGKPVSGASVQVILDQQTPVPYTSDSLGAFELEVPMKASTIRINAYKDGFEARSLLDSPRRTGPEVIALTPITERTQAAPPIARHPKSNRATQPPIPAAQPITQTTSAPCTAQSVGGNATVEGCSQTNPYKSVTTWTPDGNRTTVIGNVTHFARFFSVPVFKTTNDFQNARDWTGLLNWSDTQQKKYPDWFTPDYFAGIAQANLCEIDEANKSLTKFVTETEDADAYKLLHDRAVALLNELPNARITGQCK